MSRTMLTLVLWGSAILLLLLAVIWAGQRRLIYFPDANVPPPSAVGLAAVQTVAFAAEDGVTLHGWFLPATRSQAWFTVVVFNGNAGNRAHRAPLGDALRATGCSVLLFDYRGFGENAGTATEVGLAADARAARSYLLGRGDIDPARLVYFGESLGTAAATRLAADHPPAGLILRSPFVSMAALGRIHYPLLPVSWLLRDRFASIDDIRRVRSPLLVIAGSRDTIVPLEQSRLLYEAAPSPKRLVVVGGADHNDHELFVGDEMFGAIREFLSQLR